MMVAVDSDGVFADFDEHVLKLFGETPNRLGDERLWQAVGSEPGFWIDMPVKHGAFELWDAIHHLNPTVITGCPRTDFDRAAEHKKLWWKQHFNHDNVITCLSRDKALHIKAPGDILIDDMSKNIRRWQAAGGHGILYKNPHQALAALNALGII